MTHRAEAPDIHIDPVVVLAFAIMFFFGIWMGRRVR
jgi:hypothetical protein